MRNSNLIEVAKISTLSCKIDNYEYLTGEEMLPCNQKQIIEEAKYIYSTLGKAFEEQTKTIKDQGEKKNWSLKLEDLKLEDQTKSTEGIFLKGHENNETKNKN